jgi:hypothetical protein
LARVSSPASSAVSAREKSLDLGRLFLRSGALDNDKQYVAREFIEYVQAADPRRLPGETVKVIELGLSKGALDASDVFVSELAGAGQGPHHGGQGFARRSRKGRPRCGGWQAGRRHG